MPIPKRIYYCWFGKEKPQSVLDCINNWKEMLPDYEIIEINDHNKELFDVEKECQNNLWFKTCYENKLWAYVSDYVRLNVLYNCGGIYFDTDILVEKDITELLEKNKLILGWEDNEFVNFAVCIVNKENKIIKDILRFYNKEIWDSNLYTIPQITTYVLKKCYKIATSDRIFANDDIVIFPKDYFYPIPSCVYENPKDYVTYNTYTIHLWNASWVKSNTKYFLLNKHRIKLDKLLKKCFEVYTIINSPFLKIRRYFFIYDITIDLTYIFKFRYKYYRKQKYLTVFVFGKQIKLWKVA